MAKVILFHWIDYLVFAAFLLGSSAIGFYAGWKDRKIASAKDYLVGGRRMHWIPTSLSMQAVFLSAVSILSAPAEIYYFGTMFFFVAIGSGAAFPIASHLFLAIFYKLNLVSAYQYLEMRYDKMIRIIGAVTFFFMVILYNSILLYTPAIALAQVTGLSINISILLCGSICTIYTFFGGMKGTIWIDSMQVIVIFIGFFFLVILGSIRVGGFSKVWKTCSDGGRIIFDDFRIDPTLRNTFWSMTIGSFTSSLCLWASSQTMIQKFISVSSLKDAFKTSYFNMASNTLFLSMATAVGLVSYAFYEGCDPLMAGMVTKFDQIVPLLVMEVAGHLHGIPGIFIASIFSASLSSLSGALTAMSAVTMYDFVLPLYVHVKNHPMENRLKSFITKSLVILYGGIAIGSGYLAQYMGDSILQITISIFGFVGGPLSSLVVIGTIFPFINSWGALAGLVSSLLLTSWMAIGGIIMKSPLPILKITADRCSMETILDNSTMATVFENVTTTSLLNGNSSMPMIMTSVPWYYRMSHFLYALIALVVAISVAVPVSIITGNSKNVDPRLTLSNMCHCRFCPKKLECRHEIQENDEEKNEQIDEQLVEKNEV